jgi:hypothetical protein
MLKNYSILFLLFFIAVSCKKASHPPSSEINSFYKKVIIPDDRKTITPEEAKTFHFDKTCQYEYRTGDSQHYEYNYDVKGTDVRGDSVFGNINVEGKYGAGILINDSLGDIEINTEWIAYGKLKAIDKKRNEYHLIVK